MTSASTRIPRLLGLFCLAVLLPVFAQPALADEDDPPSRVARLAYAQGSVSFQPAGTDDWVVAPLNRPITIGDRLWSDRDGRVELQLDGSSIRLSSNTGVSFLNLSDNITQVQLTAGAVLVHVRRLDDNENYEIDTPNLAFSLLRPGLYRISVNEAGDSTAINIRSGEGEVTGGGAVYPLHANEYVTFNGTDRLRATSEDTRNNEDSLDTWAANRDRQWKDSNALRYVSADVVGYEDLDNYGSWRGTPDEGAVWFPRTSVPGWAPYHYGHWAYIEPWGYTWVDDEPWGFAPFHYGRWVFYEGSWGWVPVRPRAAGVAYVRPVYAPALVAWIGGPNFVIGMTAGGARYAPGTRVGWFPLGPREVYVPSYRVSRAYVTNVNVSNTAVNTTIVNNFYNTTVVNNNVNATNMKYVNQRVPGAVGATTPEAFIGAQPIARNAVRVDPREVAEAPARPLTPAVVPAKQAVLETGAAGAKPPAVVERRAVVAKIAPPPSLPAFEKRQEAIRSNGGRPLSVAQARQIEATAGRQAPVKMAPAATPIAPASPQANQSGQRQNGGQPAETAPNSREGVQRTPTRPADRPTERAVNPNNASQPAQVNRPAPPIHPNEIPDPPRPAGQPAANPELERRQQEEQNQLRARQEQERQRIQQQQDQQHARLAQQQADEAKRRQVEQQHQQQTQQLQQQQANERSQQQEKQQREKQQQERQQQERQKQSKPQKGDHPGDGKQ